MPEWHVEPDQRLIQVKKGQAGARLPQAGWTTLTRVNAPGAVPS
jgi:hypothetical protein